MILGSHSSDGVEFAIGEEPVEGGIAAGERIRLAVAEDAGFVEAVAAVEAAGAGREEVGDALLEGQIGTYPFVEDGGEGGGVLVVECGVADEEIVAGAADERIRPASADEDGTSGAAAQEIGIIVADEQRVAQPAGEILDVGEGAADVGGALELQVGHHITGERGIGEIVHAAAAVDVAVEPAAGEECEGIVVAAAGDGLHVGEGGAEDLDGVEADDVPGGRSAGADDGVLPGTADEGGDVAEGAGHAGGGSAGQVDRDGRGEVGIIDDIDAVTAVEISGEGSAGEEDEGVVGW